MKKDVIYLSIIILFSIIGMKALLHPGLFTAHDISHQVVRLYYYFQAINDGQFPPYWIGQLANGFGYPLFIFSYHLPWMLGVLFMQAGVDISNTIKLLFFLAYLISGITMYLFVYSLLKDRLSALVSSLLYLWLPYHFLVIFVGASMGIAFVFTFLPIVFWGIHLLGKGVKLGIPILSIGINGIILSHIMHLVFLFPSILFFTIWELLNIEKRLNFIKNIFFGIMLAVLISSFYLIPATFYRQSTRAPYESGFSILYERHFIDLKQILYSKWGFAPIVNNAKDGEISFQLGIAQWISISLLALLLILKKLPKYQRSLSLLILLTFIFNIFLMLDYSKVFWSFVVRIVTADFPFRLLLPTAFVSSIAAGIIIFSFPKKVRIWVVIFLISIALYTNRNHINVNLYTDYPIETYLDLETEKTTNTFNEYLPSTAKGNLLGRPWSEVVGENVLGSNTYQTTNLLKISLKVEKEATLSAGQFFFPGQTSYLNNSKTDFNIDNEGRINIKVPAGVYSITIKYESTPLINFSKALTSLGLIIFLYFILKYYSTGLVK